ncbi:MAG TPA: FecR domain-containing protein [Bacteroidales bacterium]|nr:FecR domain-containing protein [Bacteroidales bacterium]
MEKSEKAIYLINRFVSGEITDTESAELVQLISEGEVTTDELADFQKIWNATLNIDLTFSDPGIALRKIPPGKSGMSPGNRIFLINLLKVAAIIIFGVFIGIAINRYLLTEKDNFVEIVTKKGDKIHIRLTENNDVWLNSKSSIRYPANFTGTNRYVEIRGEAFFRLQSEDYHPVIIKCNGTNIIGNTAEFNAKTDTVTHTTQITVHSGWITLSDPMWNNEQIVLEEGFKGTIDKRLPLLIEQNRNPNYQAWKTGKLIFNETPLLAVAETLSDVYDVDIKINGEVKYCFITRTYTDKDIDVILDDIKKQSQASISRESDQIIINGNSCNM